MFIEPSFGHKFSIQIEGVAKDTIIIQS